MRDWSSSMQYRTVLQQRAALAELRAADEFAPSDHEFARRRLRETGGAARTACRRSRRASATGNAEPRERRDEHRVDAMIAFPSRLVIRARAR